MRKLLPPLAPSTVLAACATTEGSSTAGVREVTATLTSAEAPVAPSEAERPQIGRFGSDHPWYSAFAIEPGQALHLPPAQLVRIW